MKTYQEITNMAYELGEVLGNYGSYAFSEGVPSKLSELNKALIRTCVVRSMPLLLETRKILEDHSHFGDNEFIWNDSDNKSKLIHLENPEQFGITYISQNYNILVVVKLENNKMKKVSAYNFYPGKPELIERLEEYEELPKTFEELADLIMNYQHEKHVDDHYTFTLERLVKAINKDETFYENRIFDIDFTFDDSYTSGRIHKVLGKDAVDQARNMQYHWSNVYTLEGLYGLFLNIFCTLQNLKEDYNIPNVDEVEE